MLSIPARCSSASIRATICHDLRIEHMKKIAELDLAGYAIGGLAVGETDAGDV